MLSSTVKMFSFQRLLGKSVSLGNYSLRSKLCRSNYMYKISQRNSGTAPTTEGGTYVTILNSEQDAPMMINSYSANGFRLNNGIFVVGPVALFPHSILSWNIAGEEDINERSLSLFLNLSPKLDVLVIGLSDARDMKRLADIRTSVYNMMKNFPSADRINIEVLPTEKAVTTFNFLNSEQRFVGAALLPPTHYTPSVDDEYRTAYLTKKKQDGDYLASE